MTGKAAVESMYQERLCNASQFQNHIIREIGIALGISLQCSKHTRLIPDIQAICAKQGVYDTDIAWRSKPYERFNTQITSANTNIGRNTPLVSSASRHVFNATLDCSGSSSTKIRTMTLNEQFRVWLAEYARKQEQLRLYDETIKELRGKLKVGRKLSRDQMNER